MTPALLQPTMVQDNDGGDQLTALVQGRHNVHRLLQHTCLLERRLRGGGEPTDLLLLVLDIKFAVEELQTLLQFAEQAVLPAGRSGARTADKREPHPPTRPRRVELGPLLTHCVSAARQRLHGNGTSVLFHIAADLPVLTTDPETVRHILSLLFEHAITSSGREEREVHVQWTNETLVVDIDDAGRGLAQETYTRLRQLVEQLDGTFRVSHELGQRSRVELTFPPAAPSGSAVGPVVPLHRKGHGR